MPPGGGQGPRGPGDVKGEGVAAIRDCQVGFPALESIITIIWKAERISAQGVIKEGPFKDFPRRRQAYVSILVWETYTQEGVARDGDQSAQHGGANSTANSSAKFDRQLERQFERQFLVKKSAS